jgi:hypothetical protein
MMPGPNAASLKPDMLLSKAYAKRTAMGAAVGSSTPKVVLHGHPQQKYSYYK